MTSLGMVGDVIRDGGDVISDGWLPTEWAMTGLAIAILLGLLCPWHYVSLWVLNGFDEGIISSVLEWGYEGGCT